MCVFLLELVGFVCERKARRESRSVRVRERERERERQSLSLEHVTKDKHGSSPVCSSRQQYTLKTYLAFKTLSTFQFFIIKIKLNLSLLTSLWDMSHLDIQNKIKTHSHPRLDEVRLIDIIGMTMMSSLIDQI